MNVRTGFTFEWNVPLKKTKELLTVNWKLVSFVFFISASPAGWLSECCESYCRRVKKTGRKKKKRGHAAGGSCFNIPTCCCFWICNALWRKEQTVSRAQRRPSKTLWKEHTAMEDNSEPPWPPPVSAHQPKVRWHRTVFACAWTLHTWWFNSQSSITTRVGSPHGCLHHSRMIEELSLKSTITEPVDYSERGSWRD